MITTVSRVQALAQDIEQSIAQRRMEPGDRIATMDELRSTTGLARQTISEAARLLAERGTVEIRPGRGGGLFVAPVSPVVRLRRTLLSVPEGTSSVADAIAVREALEALIATDAARFRTPADVQDLRRHLRLLKRSANATKSFVKANFALHERIAEITPNGLGRSIYIGTLHSIAERPAAPELSRQEELEYLQSRLAIHVALVEAIIARDLAATRAAVEAHRGSQEI